MAPHYISQHLREDIVKILVSAAVIEEFKLQNEDEYRKLFGAQAWGWLKQANTLIIKAFAKGLTPTIGLEEAHKIKELSLKRRMVLLRKSEPQPVDFSSVPTRKLYDLAEMAIANRCVGCTITAHKTCELFLALDAVDMPRACYDKGVCPYVQ